MKVLAIKYRTAVILVLTFVTIIVFGVLFLYGNAKDEGKAVPEIEIVLP